jgi:peroxiredoxin Q/BCP
MLTIGQPVPDFELPNQDDQPVRLSSFRGRKVVLFAFPKANEMSAGCIQQACEFRDEFPRIEGSNAVVLGLSIDKAADLKKWAEKRRLPYDLLADTDHQVIEAWGAWGMGFAGLLKVPLVNRSLWVIDENGILIDQQIGIMPKTSVERAVKALEAAPVMA